MAINYRSFFGLIFFWRPSRGRWRYMYRDWWASCAFGRTLKMLVPKDAMFVGASMLFGALHRILGRKRDTTYAFILDRSLFITFFVDQKAGIQSRTPKKFNCAHFFSSAQNSESMGSTPTDFWPRKEKHFHRKMFLLPKFILRCTLKLHNYRLIYSICPFQTENAKFLLETLKFFKMGY